MPWTVADVDKHKKGLTDKGKAQWCRIANSVLSRCMAKGMSEADCAASAIKQANGVVNANAVDTGYAGYATYTNKQTLSYEPKFTVHQDKAHLIVPVVMMVEGVHKGNLGAIYHKIEELGKVPASWNGIPVVVRHPEEDGVAISANSPDIIDQMIVGRVYNTNVDGDKLKAEVWFDEEKLNNICVQTLKDINSSKEVEVSLGMFADYEETEGEWHGEKYIAVAHNHRPDHLAILPDQVGACSCADGCGIGANVDQKTAKLFLDNAKKWLGERDKDKWGDILESGKFEDGTTIKLSINQLKKEKMANEKCPKCAEKINALIANTESGFVEGDREWLETLSETALNKVITPKVKEVEKIVEKEKIVEVNKLTPEQTASIAFAEKMRTDKRNERIQSIQNNTSKEVWPDAVLNTMNEDVLERLCDSTKKEPIVDYSIIGGGIPPISANASGEKAMAPTGIKFKEAKK